MDTNTIKELFDEEDTLILFNVDEVFNKTVKAQGNGAMVTIPKKYLGRHVKVILLKDD